MNDQVKKVELGPTRNPMAHLPLLKLNIDWANGNGLNGFGYSCRLLPGCFFLEEMMGHQFWHNFVSQLTIICRIIIDKSILMGYIETHFTNYITLYNELWYKIMLKLIFLAFLYFLVLINHYYVSLTNHDASLVASCHVVHFHTLTCLFSKY